MINPTRRRSTLDLLPVDKPPRKGLLRRLLPNNSALAESEIKAGELAAQHEIRRAEILKTATDAQRDQATTKSQHLAFSISPQAGDAEIEAAVTEFVERAAREVPNAAVRILKLEERVGKKEEEQKRLLDDAAPEKGKETIFKPLLRRRDTNMSHAARLALVVLSPIEAVVLRPHFDQYLDRHDILESGRATWNATIGFVVLANLLLFFAVNLGARYLEAKRLADSTDTEPPANSTLIALEVVGIAAVLFQIGMMFVRFQEKTGETVDTTGVLVSLLVVLGVYLLAGVEFMCCSLAVPWNEKLFRKIEGNHTTIHFELLPALTYLKQRDQDARLDAMSVAAASLDHRYGDAARSYIADIERVAAYEPPDGIPWPEAILPETGKWGRGAVDGVVEFRRKAS